MLHFYNCHSDTEVNKNLISTKTEHTHNTRHKQSHCLRVSYEYPVSDQPKPVCVYVCVPVVCVCGKKQTDSDVGANLPSISHLIDDTPVSL